MKERVRNSLRKKKNRIKKKAKKPSVDTDAEDTEDIEDDLKDLLADPELKKMMDNLDIGDLSDEISDFEEGELDGLTLEEQVDALLRKEGI